MKNKIVRILGAFGATCLLIFSYVLPVITLAAEASVGTELEIDSAEMSSLNTEEYYLEVEMSVKNEGATPVKKEINFLGNKLVDKKRETLAGYAFEVSSNTIYVVVSPATIKTFSLSLSVDPSSYQANQDNQLVVDNKIYQVNDVINQQKEDVQVAELPTAHSDAPLDSSSEMNKEAPASLEQGSVTEEETYPFEQAVLPRMKREAYLENQVITPEYTTDTYGTYPAASWKPSDGMHVRNHQGNKNGSTQWDGVTSWDGAPTNQTNSYIEYGGTGDTADYAIRKYAKESAVPGMFDLYLNVRGNVQKEMLPLDLVLVVDWSGSMNDYNRIGEVQEGVNRFIDALEETGITESVNLGYIGYSSYGYNNQNVPIGSFDSVKDQIKNVTPSSVSGGTFTQKGLRDAGNMLSSPNGHKKIIVLLTDGVPTTSYKVTGVQTQTDGSYYGSSFSNSLDEPGNTSYISRYYNAPDQYGSYKRINSTFIATIGEAMALKQRGIEIHGLGIQLQGDSPAGLSSQAVENRMRQMVSKDENGEFYYESAVQASNISDYLAKKAVQISGTVVNGRIIDPILAPFIYEPNSLSIKSVGSDALVTTPTIKFEENSVKSNQIYLSKNQELQIHYQVRIQTEAESFKSDFWYQMNGKTTFQPVITESEIAEFGIPSAKAPGVKLTVKKYWEEFDQDTSSRPEHIVYEISREKITDSNSWQKGYIRINRPDEDNTNSWIREEVTQLAKTDGEAYEEVLHLPRYNNLGEELVYQARREMAVPGYDQQQIDAMAWKNTKQFTPLDLNIIKNSSSGVQHLSGAVFTLSEENEQVTLVDHGDGSYSLPTTFRLQKDKNYTLTETKAPDGHELTNKKTWEIQVNTEGSVLVDGKKVDTKDHVIQLTLENNFSSIPIAVRKYTLQGGTKEVNLAAAVFELQYKDEKDQYQKVESQTSDTEGLADFTLLTPGNYRIVETAGPKGYDTISGNYEFQVDKYGKINYDGANVDNDTDKWTITHGNKLKPFDLTVYKKEENGQTLVGARFKLEGPNVEIELPEEEIQTDTFVFKNLHPGRYTLTETFTPEGYQGLKKPIVLVLGEDGIVTIDGKIQSDLLESGTQNNQIVLEVSNQAKVPLPETGGKGRLEFNLLGLGGTTISISYLFLRRKRREI